MTRKFLLAILFPVTALALTVLTSCEPAKIPSDNTPSKETAASTVDGPSKTTTETVKTVAEPSKATTETVKTVTEPAKTSAEASGTIINSANAGTESAKTLTEADNGKTVKAKVGDSLSFSIKGNPTTGYSWRIAKLDGPALESAGDVKYTTDKHADGMVGVGGTFVFEFNAAKVGKTVVNMEYVRPWEKDKAPAKTIVATVEVE